MHKNKAFTLVEAVIIIIILGLLVSMAIPAFIKIRESEYQKLAERVQRGDHLTLAEKYNLEKYQREHPDFIVSVNKSKYQKINVNGKEFYIIPVEDFDRLER